MQGFIITVLIIFAVFYLIRFFARMALSNIIKHTQENIREQQRARNPRKEGEITIEDHSKKPTNQKAREGEYVDFEEVDE